MKKTKLDARLLAVASMVRKGAYLADVGTDHAYLPVYLAEENIIAGAVASDIHKGPLESADKNIREAGFSDKIQTLLTDGLQGVEKYPVTDIAIAGMGGLMIRNILEKAHELPYGDLLVDFLKMFVKYFINHVHPYPGVPQYSEGEGVRYLSNFDFNSLLSESVRIN